MLNKFLATSIITILTLLFLVTPQFMHAEAAYPERINLAPDGSETTGGGAYVTLSADGRYVAYYSHSTNLVPNDTNGVQDIFVHDRQTGTTERISVASDGTEANNLSFLPVISADGRYVAFSSLATNLVPNDTNDNYDVFVHDRQTGTTEIVSVASDGTHGDNAARASAISADGRYVAFDSFSSNLAPNDGDLTTDVFLHDRQTGTTELVSVNSAGTAGNRSSFDPSMSSDGRYIAFGSNATNLDSVDDGQTILDWFVRDRQTGTTKLVSITADGTQAANTGAHGFISDNGRYTTFLSNSTDLGPNDTNGFLDLFVKDLQTNITQLASVASDGTQANSFSGDRFNDTSKGISADGRFIVFTSPASNLVPNDTNGMSDIFVHDRVTGATARVSIAADGTEANARSVSQTVSSDGKFISFITVASNLVPNDTNGVTDVFVTLNPLYSSNTPPTVGTITASVNPVQVNTATSVSASFTDPDASDTHTAVWDWGDGSTSAGSVSGGTVTGTHSYTTAGVYTVGLTVTDTQGQSASATYQYLTVYTPVFGKASGSKEFISPAGAVVGNAGATGKADFGFQVDYHQGDTVPSGADVELNFPAGNIDFVSSAYEWVVINGTKATLKATGSLNGVTGYTVLVSAIDQGNSGGLIRFQIKNASGTVVYDTQLGAADTADPTLPVSKGKIKVQ